MECFGNVARDKSVTDDTTKVTRNGRSDLKMPSSYSIIVERDEHFLAAVSENIPSCGKSSGQFHVCISIPILIKTIPFKLQLRYEIPRAIQFR